MPHRTNRDLRSLYKAGRTRAYHPSIGFRTIRIPAHSARRLLHRIDVDEPLENPPFMRVTGDILIESMYEKKLYPVSTVPGQPDLENCR